MAPSKAGLSEGRPGPCCPQPVWPERPFLAAALPATLPRPRALSARSLCQVFCHLPAQSPFCPSSASPGSHSAFPELPRGRSVPSSQGARLSPQASRLAPPPKSGRTSAWVPPSAGGASGQTGGIQDSPSSAQIARRRRLPLGRGLARQPGLLAQRGEVRCRRRAPAPAGRRAWRAPGCGRGSLGAHSRAAGLRDRLRGHLLRYRPFTLACAHGPRWKARS